MSKFSFINLSFFCISLLVVTPAWSQDFLEPELAPLVEEEKPLVMHVTSDTRQNDDDLFVHVIDSIISESFALKISQQNQDADFFNGVEFNLPIEKIKWMSVLPRELLPSLVDGISIEGEQKGEYLYFRKEPAPLGTIEDFVEEVEGAQPVTIEEQGSTLSSVVDGAEDFGFADEQLTPLLENNLNLDQSFNELERFVSINRSDLWKSHPQKLIELLSHLRVGGAIINIPTNFNGSFPVSPIELQRFISLATQQNIKVFAVIEEDLVPNESGASKSEMALAEFVNYNNYVPLEARLAGVQLKVNWTEIETFYFNKINWFERAVDLYVSLGVGQDVLSVDIVLPQQILSELQNENIFKRLSVVADGFTIQVEEASQEAIANLLNPLALWAEENTTSFRVAIARKNLDSLVSGWMLPNQEGAVRLFSLNNNWAVLLMVEEEGFAEGESLEIGSGFDFIENEIENNMDFFGADLFEIEKKINGTQELNMRFEGVTLVGLPEFND